MTDKSRDCRYSVFWNCGLILVGTLIQAIGFKGLGEPQGFVPGGLFGVATLIHYNTGLLLTGILYLLLNIPMFILGYLFVSRRFLGHSFLAMLALSLFFQVIHFRNQLKRLEEIVFTADPHAMFVVENTFTVTGSTFSRRKIY